MKPFSAAFFGAVSTYALTNDFCVGLYLTAQSYKKRLLQFL